jgi:gamma-glutamylcyclotransferase (GGCT)/AIG2-like uncharacterized protein YtfP
MHPSLIEGAPAQQPEFDALSFRVAPAESARVRLFVYGTLLDEARLRAVAGRTFPRRAARLPGHRRVWPCGGYPTVVPDASADVAGALLDDVDAAALAALDAYEDAGVLYDRVDATVIVDGAPTSCQLYRARRAPGGRRHRASGA